MGHSWGALLSIYNRGSQLGCFKVHLQSWVTAGVLYSPFTIVGHSWGALKSIYAVVSIECAESQGYHGRKNQLSPGKVSPGGATRERGLLTVNPGTGPTIGETVLGTGVPPGGLIREHRLRRGP